MKTLITIDWDFFCPEKPEWDLGHQESLMFLKMLWGGRIGLLNEMKTDGNELIFWDWIRKKVNIDRAPMFVSDSHCFAYNLLKGVDRVISFDAHHDCWEGDSLGVDKSERGVFCHNWLREWLGGSRRRKATWVAPIWLGEDCPLPEGVERLEKKIWSQFTDLDIEGSVVVHVCRSGCWVPPWLDKAFLAFLKRSGRGLERMAVQQVGDWNPLAERWTEKDFQEILAQEENIKRVCDGMKKCHSPALRQPQIRTGEMSSRNFLDYKVEQKV